MNPPFPVSGHTPHQLIARLAQVRAQLRALIDCLPADGWTGPVADHLNPPLWEFGHIVWFAERWCLRTQSDGSLVPSLLANTDALYDSSTVPHDCRWTLPLLSPAEVDAYAAQVTAAIAARLHRECDNTLAYFAELCVLHELMHIEAWWMAFQNLGYAPPSLPRRAALPNQAALPETAARMSFAASDVALGAQTDAGFIFDNEKWQHTVRVPAFEIDAAPIEETRFAAFIEAGGYQNQKLWSEAGWHWRTANDAGHPIYWRKHNGDWQVRRFADWSALSEHIPMLHLNRFEAEACAAWLGRRLPSAAQWQCATARPEFLWVQCWEWTRDAFAPYPGFTPDPYQDYSQPWFHSHTELRGGSAVTDAALKRIGFRNFYLPHRRDPFAGFRTVDDSASEDGLG